MYIPTNSISLTNPPIKQIRLGLQGKPGWGKTHAMATFPNLHVLDLDNKLGALAGRAITSTPIWDSKWRTEKYGKMEAHNCVLRWLEIEGPKFSPEQTLGIDSLTRALSWFQMKMDVPYYTAQGKEDGFKYWNLLLKYCTIFIELVHLLPCHVVMTCHETVDKDDQGRITGIKPLVQGSFADKIAGNFTDWFRQVVKAKKNEKGEEIKIDGNLVPEYLWQIKSDNIAQCLCSIPAWKLPGNLMCVPAGYEFFEKYK